ncbi:hypothetical protein [Acidithrix sp. C25]|uniref:hypothetical protein n=1 Tax=Acidithrix sp. C25 TaxID=1671482 RepID=UPI001BC323CF|nr:hypothetical protein [Acidithrix sp. C25]CAG4910091.1 unnamed protein product [Acidithrix sp. C25]
MTPDLQDMNQIDREKRRFSDYVLEGSGDKGIALITALLLFILFDAPLWLHSNLFLLDWVLPKRQPLLDPTLLGLNTTGISSGAVFSTLIKVVQIFAGGYTTDLVLLTTFICGSLGIFKLISTRSPSAKIAATTLFLYNPFVFDRLYVGQLSLLVGYSLLPLSFVYLKSITDKRGWLRFGVVWSIMILASPHYFWIVGIVVLVFMIASIKRGEVIVGTLKAGVFVAASMVYQLITVLISGANGVVTSANLSAYRTSGSTWYGALGNLIGLYGFWRRGPKLARDIIVGWPLILVCILSIAALGISVIFAKRKSIDDGRPNHVNVPNYRFEKILLLSSLFAIVLALGSQGPSKPLFDTLFRYVPTFGAMREAQKFDVIWAVTLAYFFGIGVDTLLLRYEGKHRFKVAIAIIAVALPFAYEPVEPFALNGQIASSNFPSDWSSAYNIVSKGSGYSLCLPWHLYEEFKFSGGRVIANPCANYFGPNTISSQDAELPGLLTTNTTYYYAYLNYLITKSNYFANFGETLNSLGIQFVILFKTADFKNYSWLNHQSDMKLVFDGPTIEIYKNLDFQTSRPVVKEPVTVSSWGSLISMEQTQRLANTVTVTSRFESGPITPPKSPTNPQVVGRAKVRIDPYGSISVSSSSNGYVEVPLPWIRGWTYQNNEVLPSASGQIYLYVHAGISYITFKPKHLSLIGDAISLITFAFGVLYLVADRPFRKRQTISSEIPQPN